MSSDFASITETPGALLSPEQYARFLHRYAFGLREGGLLGGGRHVLEVGCGAGSGLAAWQETGNFVAGLEYVEQSLQIARANLGNALALLGGDAQRLPFGDGSFDAVASFEMIYYLPDLAAFLREGRRVLARGGKLILCWSNPDWLAFVAGQQSLHYPSLPEAVQLVARAGFTDVRCHGAFASTEISAKARIINRARQVATKTGMSRVLQTFAVPIMRRAYGELTPLPARLTLTQIAEFEPRTTPLQPLFRDSIHRVLYLVATAAG